MFRSSVEKLMYLLIPFMELFQSELVAALSNPWCPEMPPKAASAARSSRKWLMMPSSPVSFGFRILEMVRKRLGTFKKASTGTWKPFAHQTEPLTGHFQWPTAHQRVPCNAPGITQFANPWPMSYSSEYSGVRILVVHGQSLISSSWS